MPSAAITSVSAPPGCVRACFAPANDATVFVLPGDCFAADAYGPLADRFFEQGANAFVLDYVAATGLAGDRVTNADCVRAATLAVQRVRDAYGLRSGGPEYLLGHSRGAYVAIAALGELRVRGLLLHAPYWGPAYAGRPSLSVAAEVASSLLRGKPIRLSFPTFRRRFFGDDVAEQVARQEWERSSELSRGLLRDRIQFDLGVLRSCEVAVWVYAADRAMPAARMLRTIAALSRDFDIRLRVTVLPGAHAEVIARPGRCAQVVDRCLL